MYLVKNTNKTSNKSTLDATELFTAPLTD